MDIEACKRDIAIPEFLSRQGVVLREDRAGQWWGLSPLHRENTPSFMVAVDRRHGHWYWRNWADGESGDILHLVLRLGLVETQTMGAALRFLNDLYGGGIPRDWRLADDDRAPVFPAGGPLSDRLVIDRVGRITNRALSGYAAGRGIPASVLTRHAHEVWWHDTTPPKTPPKESEKPRPPRAFFALGMRNLSGGMELRNSKWKGCIGHKDLSVFSAGTAATVDVVEGMFDALTLVAEGEAEGRILVLNSVGLKKRGIAWIREHAADHEVRLHLDHDEKGREATGAFLDAFPHARDRSSRFDFWPDLNAWWCDCGRLAAAAADASASAQA